MIFWKLTVLAVLWVNIAFSQPVVKVWGTEKSETIENKLQIYLKYLEVYEDILVSVNFHPTMPHHLQGITTSFITTSPDRKKVIQVLVDGRASESMQWLILAHEMIHVKQFAKNELFIHDHRTISWKGKLFYDCSYGDPQLPWEKEAKENDQSLVKHCRKQNF